MVAYSDLRFRGDAGAIYYTGVVQYFPVGSTVFAFPSAQPNGNGRGNTELDRSLFTPHLRERHGRIGRVMDQNPHIYGTPTGGGTWEEVMSSGGSIDVRDYERANHGIQQFGNHPSVNNPSRPAQPNGRGNTEPDRSLFSPHLRERNGRIGQMMDQNPHIYGKPTNGITWAEVMSSGGIYLDMRDYERANHGIQQFGSDSSVNPPSRPAQPNRRGVV